MARFVLFQNKETGRVDQVLVAEADHDLAEQIVNTNVGDEFGAHFLIVTDGHDVEVR